jgi:hypothetical protein
MTMQGIAYSYSASLYLFCCMTVSGRLKITIAIFIISMAGHVISHFTQRKHLGTFYPFFSWKLFSQPLGTNHQVTEYRIYSRAGGAATFERNPVKALPDLSPDDYVYTLDFLVSQTLRDSLQEHDYKHTLFEFVQHVVPGSDSYKIVSETYDPKQLLNNNAQYDTATVITF